MNWLKDNAGLIIEIFVALIFIGGWIWNYFNKAYKLKRSNEGFHELVQSHETEIKKHRKELEDVNATIEKMFVILKEQDEQSKKTDCAILRNMIIDKYKMCKEIYDETGYISALDYENLNEMFSRYFASGGNHLISKIYKSFSEWSVSLDELEY